MATVRIKLREVEVEGLTIQDIVNRLGRMKSELEQLGCEVSINLGGQEIDDILLGKKSVAVKSSVEEVQS